MKVTAVQSDATWSLQGQDALRPTTMPWAMQLITNGLDGAYGSLYPRHPSLFNLTLAHRIVTILGELTEAIHQDRIEEARIDKERERALRERQLRRRLLEDGSRPGDPPTSIYRLHPAQIVAYLVIAAKA